MCKTYECWNDTFLSVDFFVAKRIDEILKDLKQTGLMSHSVKQDSIVFVTYPSGRKVELCF